MLSLALRADRSPHMHVFSFEKGYKPALESILRSTLAAVENKYARDAKG